MNMELVFIKTVNPNQKKLRNRVIAPPNSEIEIVGNSTSSALIHSAAGVVKLALPFLDSPSLFSLTAPFKISPVSEYRAEMKRLRNTFVVNTEFETAHGKGRIIDWMPEDGEPVLYRKVEGTEGSIHWQIKLQTRIDWPIRFDRWRTGFLIHSLGNNDHFLQLSVPIEEVEVREPSTNTLLIDFTLKEGQSLIISFSHGRWIPHLEHHTSSLNRTISYWRNRAHHCVGSCLFAGPWHEDVANSILLLQLLNQPFSGSFADAIDAPHVRTIECRDAPFLLQALMNTLPYTEGTHTTVEHYLEFVSYLLERDAPGNLDCSYELDGSRVDESESEYNNSLIQCAYLILTLSEFSRVNRRFQKRLWPKLGLIADELCQSWKRPDGRKHYTGPKLLIWGTLDRMEGLAREAGETVPLHWRREKEILGRVLIAQGIDPQSHLLVNAFEDSSPGSSSLWAPFLRFFPANDSRLRDTLRQLPPLSFFSPSEQLLGIGALALVGDAESSTDALRQFIIKKQNSKSCWIATAYEYPSLSAHIHLINAALYVAMAHGRLLPNHYLLGMPELMAAPSVREPLVRRFRQRAKKKLG